jgi:hypothetical protein
MDWKGLRRKGVMAHHKRLLPCYSSADWRKLWTSCQSWYFELGTEKSLMHYYGANHTVSWKNVMNYKINWPYPKITYQFPLSKYRDQSFHWTNCAFGLYPSSGVSRTNKIEKLKIQTKDHDTHVHKQTTQGSITNLLATYLCAHTHKPLKPVKHRWQ